MLEKIKQQLNDTEKSDETFRKVFQTYVMGIQDKCIENEFRHFRSGKAWSMSQIRRQLEEESKKIND